MSQIYIYSGPTHSGKTTRLEAWIGKIQSVDGILMPVIKNERYIKYISTGQQHQLEFNSNDSEQVQQIGKYRFRTEIFQKAQNYLMDLVDRKPKWIIVDEIGFLEINGQGFEPAVSQLIRVLESKQDMNLILVIRDYLKDEVISYYNLDVTNINDFYLE